MERNMMVHYDSCPVCHGKNIKPVFSVTDHFVSDEVFSLIKCHDCGFIFTQDHPNTAVISRYYQSEEYISHTNTSKGVINSLYHLARGIMLARKYKFVKRATGLNRGGIILDIGSGTGHFPGYMKSKGWQATGIEIDDQAGRFAHDKFGIDIYKPCELDNFEDDSFDVITLWHVLEHLDKPDQIVSSISRLLKNRGTCIIALPNNNSSDARFYKKHWAAWDVPRHLWHFNINSFKTFMKDKGFEIIRIRKLPFDAIYVSFLSEKYLKNRLGFIRGVIIGVFSWFVSLFIKNRCSSLVYILRKKQPF
ncbi:MAG: class I SAM-dependent methyltransferase [Bacteroidales bacterium]|nr:class I SAM-dependent methyltransferase [Bacteroidales bacterium]